MENYLIEHCSPTLASIKTANLFTYTFQCEQEFVECLLKINHILNERGVYVEPLQIRDGRALIWVYRRSQIKQRLQETEINKFLEMQGYNLATIEGVIEYLKERVQEAGGFPHEIGVFLGYPLADVVAFIKHGGKNSKCTGCWKVYTDEIEAIRIFAMYEKCKSLYKKMFSLGKSIMQLTVVA